MLSPNRGYFNSEEIQQHRDRTVRQCARAAGAVVRRERVGHAFRNRAAGLSRWVLITRGSSPRTDHFILRPKVASTRNHKSTPRANVSLRDSIGSALTRESGICESRY
jgi:hypothetical protein